MVNIKLPDNYLLLSDSKQWIIAKQDNNRVNHISFHSTLQGAITSYFMRKTRLSNATSINSLLVYQKSLHAALNKALSPLQIRIESSNSQSKPSEVKDE